MKIASRFESFPPYKPIEPFDVLSRRLGLEAEEIVKLDANENPYGPSPLALQALANLSFPNIYPDPESRTLRESLAAFTGVPAEYLLAGAGADELIDLLLRILLEKGDRVLSFPPTFGMYSFDTLLNDGQLIEFPREDDFSLNLNKIEGLIKEEKPKIIFITNPNNPDGRLMSEEELRFFLTQPALIVLDEAYIEFSDNGQDFGKANSLIQEVPGRDNLIVLRTFSKWAGLAGLRVGYGAFPKWLLPTLWKVKQPYNVNVAANAAACASLQDLNILKERITLLVNERKTLYQELQGIPYLQPFPSWSNFILCKVLNTPARELQEKMARRGIMLRYYENKYLKDFIRISVGKPQDSLKLLQNLKTL